jgi:hypothetical protein
MNLQSDHQSKSMTRGGREVMAGQWQDMLGRLDVQDVFDQS